MTNYTINEKIFAKAAAEAGLTISKMMELWETIISDDETIVETATVETAPAPATEILYEDAGNIIIKSGKVVLMYCKRSANMQAYFLEREQWEGADKTALDYFKKGCDDEHDVNWGWYIPWMKHDEMVQSINGEGMWFNYRTPLMQAVITNYSKDVATAIDKLMDLI